MKGQPPRRHLMPDAEISSKYIANRRQGLYKLLHSDLCDSWMILSYIWKYRINHIGLQFFLINRLSECSDKDIFFLIPQLW